MVLAVSASAAEENGQPQPQRDRRKRRNRCILPASVVVASAVALRSASFELKIAHGSELIHRASSIDGFSNLGGLSGSPPGRPDFHSQANNLRLRTKISPYLRTVRQAYTTLQEEEIEGIDIADIAKVSSDLLTSEEFPFSTIFVKSIERSGASDILVWPGENGVKHMSFDMDMGIPWPKVSRVEGWTGGDNDSGSDKEQLESSSSAVRVETTLEPVRKNDNGVLSLEITFSMTRTVLNRILPRLLVQFIPGSSLGVPTQVWIGGNIEWTKSCNFLIRKPMAVGFMAGLRRYSKAILEELKLQAASGELSRPTTMELAAR
eukprot:TRINITY_DN69104_c0_g1_i1.p1 TRINITY_DN69104_c0_g1~~TRINITY_DN69104_c0_g1_i1.p1  ORF type:complete len:320 (+),score=38.83 TRINITY_DN69104_c0_g1_i1:52-1011(+)